MSDESVPYDGIEAFLGQSLGRRLAHAERGTIPSYLEVDEKHLSEARKLRSVSAAFAVAYIRYIMRPDIARYAKDYVYRVFDVGENVRDLVEKGVLPK
jgi:hypothetical protein